MGNLRNKTNTKPPSAKEGARQDGRMTPKSIYGQLFKRKGKKRSIGEKWGPP